MLGRHCTDREQRAEKAERELTKAKLLAYLSERIGEEMDAVITGVESYGLFVQGVKLPAEGLVRIETLRDDTYRFDRASHTLAGHRARKTATAWATWCAWPSPASISNAGKSIFAWWRGSGNRRQTAPLGARRPNRPARGEGPEDAARRD